MAAEPEHEVAAKQIVCGPAIMKAPPMNSWNDDRLNELSARTDAGFQEVKAEIRDVRGEIRDVRGEIRDVRGEMKEGFKEVNQRFDRLTNILIVTVIAAILEKVLLG